MIRSSPKRQIGKLNPVGAKVQIHDTILSYSTDHSQFVIATHSPILMAYPNAEIIVLSEDGAEATPYKETEHYTLTKRFLKSPETMLRYLLEK